MYLIKKSIDYLKSIVEKPDLITALSQVTNLTAISIRNAISDVIEGHYSLEEKAAIENIENLRSRLLTSNDPVNIISYGAGSPTAKKSEEKMYKGISVSNTIGNICRTTSKPPFWAQILFKIIRHTKVEKCLELGTSVGISGLYQASALRLNGAGVLKTMEGSPEVAEIAKNNFNSLEIKNVSVVVGRFQDNLDTLLEEGNYDYAFIDGHHDRDATILYFNRIYHGFSPQGLIVFDDIKWSDGMIEAWNSIIADKRITVSIDLGPIGICVINKNSQEKNDYKIRLPNYDLKKKGK